MDKIRRTNNTIIDKWFVNALALTLTKVSIDSYSRIKEKLLKTKILVNIFLNFRTKFLDSCSFIHNFKLSDSYEANMYILEIKKEKFYDFHVDYCWSLVFNCYMASKIWQHKLRHLDLHP